MKLRLILLAGMLMAGMGQAASISYVLQFTGGGSTQPTGGFQYDPTTQLFSNFIVQFLSTSFNLTNFANNPVIVGTADCRGTAPNGGADTLAALTGDPASGCGLRTWTGGSGSFQLLLRETNASTDRVLIGLSKAVVVAPSPGTGGCLNCTAQGGTGGVSPQAVAVGTFIAVEENTVPEPGTWMMSLSAVLAGVGYGVSKRRR